MPGILVNSGLIEVGLNQINTQCPQSSIALLANNCFVITTYNIESARYATDAMLRLVILTGVSYPHLINRRCIDYLGQTPPTARLIFSASRSLILNGTLGTFANVKQIRLKHKTFCCFIVISDQGINNGGCPNRNGNDIAM